MYSLVVTVGSDASRIIVACVLLIVAIIILSLGILWYRRRCLNTSETTSATPWTLEDMRALYERGDITEAEYRAMRESMIASLKAGKTPDSETTATQEGDGGIT